MTEDLLESIMFIRFIDGIVVDIVVAAVKIISTYEIVIIVVVVDVIVHVEVVIHSRGVVDIEFILRCFIIL